MRYLILSSFLFLAICIEAQQLVGPTEVCEFECYSYKLDNATAGPYIWKIGGGIVDNNKGAEVEICWLEATIGNIEVIEIVLGTTALVVSQNISVVDKPQTDILLPIYPLCTAKDSIRQPDQEYQEADYCIAVCPGAKAVYKPQNQENFSRTWFTESEVSRERVGDNLEVVWPESGSGMLMLIEENTDGCIDSVRYCIEVMEKPELSWELLNNLANLSSLCQGQEIFLKANSDEALEYRWEVSDGQVISGKEAKFSFDNPGNYTISLLTTTECKCVDITEINVTVLDGKSPVIECTGTICSGEQATYYAGEECSSYNWQIQGGGTIVDGGTTTDNFVTVEWNGGPYGRVILETAGCQSTGICNNAAEAIIPIMAASVGIDGPNVVCKDGSNSYSVPFYHGANYSWSLSGNGYISSGHGTQTVGITWNSDPSAQNNAVLSVTIENCFLECQTEGTLNIELKPKWIISSNANFCEGDQPDVIAVVEWDVIPVDWSVTLPDGTDEVVALNERFISSYTFDAGPGFYEFHATETSGAYCNNQESAVVEVFAKPEMPLEILGPKEICIGEAYEYAGLPLSGEYEYKWIIKDGNRVSSFSGDRVFVEWESSGPWSIIILTTDIATSCESESLEVDLSQVSGGILEGATMVCLDDQTTHQIKDIDASNAEWMISPPNSGTLSNNGSGEIAVHWHEVGKHNLTAEYCGFQYIVEVEVLAGEEPMLVYPEGVCPGEQAELNVNNGAGTSFVVLDEDENILGTTTPMLIDPGFYGVELIDANGCKSFESFSIVEYTEPEVNISSLGWHLLCSPGGVATIEALATNEGLDYQWFQDNIPYGTNDAQLLADREGLYRVEVTNQDGCVNQQAVQLVCREPSQCSCRSDGGTRFRSQQASFCNEYDFFNTSFDFIPGTLRYNFGDPDSGSDNTSTDENPSHIFTKAGHYIVTLSGQVPSTNRPDDSCPATYRGYVTVQAVADFDHLPACTETAMQFEENSNFLPDFSIAGYQWDFGDPVSAADNSSTMQNPSHTYSTPGIYTVTLIITTNTGCMSRIEKEVEVEEPPVLDFDLPSSRCLDQGLEFKSLSAQVFNLSWDFGDPATGAANNSSSETPIHAFDQAKTYQVTLEAENIYGCIQKITKSIEILGADIIGEITMDKAMPMCYGEVVELSGPSGGAAYLWSTGETTEKINVSEAGIFKVTVTGISGCEHETDQVVVNTNKPINPNIYAYVENDFNSQRIQGKIEICQYERFSLGTNWFSNATYRWSTGNTNTWVPYNDLSGLGIGEHLVTLEVEDGNSGCIIQAEPLIVIIHPRPDNIMISSNQTDLCEGDEHIISVDNSDPKLSYYWSNGEYGTSIKVRQADYYYVTAVNEFGCSRTSNNVQIYPLPNVDAFITGCHEVCFPEELCLGNTFLLSDVEWMKNGEPISGGSGFSYLADGPGDYQAILINSYGCKDTTAILSLSPETKEQTLTGAVFIDNDGDGLFSAGDSPLGGMTLNVMSGNTIIQTVSTDSNGEYLIDPVKIADAVLVLDTLGLNLDPALSESSYAFNLVQCVEDLEINFPLILGCAPHFNATEIFTCLNEPISFEGKMYAALEKDTFFFVNAAGCDSIVYLDVLPFPDPDFTFEVIETCEDEGNGYLRILTTSSNDLEFSVDNSNDFSTETVYENLSEGTHSLFIVDENGCEHVTTFEVRVFDTPAYNIEVMVDCDTAVPGVLQLDNLGGGSLEISIDDNLSFGTDLTLAGISAGSHDIYIKDENGCIYMDQFFVEELIEPEVLFEPGMSCSNNGSGTLNIIGTVNNSIMYSVNDSDNFTSDLSFIDLNVGNHILYVQDEFGCVYSFDFSIDAFVLPSVQVDVENTCEGQSEGVAELLTGAGGMTYSIDGLNFNTDTQIENLGAGSHVIYARDENGCIQELPFNIAIIPMPDLTITSEPSCEALETGSIEVNSSSLDLSYSLDGVNYQDESVFVNIVAGDHSVFVKTNEGCIIERVISIAMVESFIVDFSTAPSCYDEASGSIIVNSEADILCSLDGNVFTSDPIFTNLGAGTHTIYVKDQVGCSQEHSVEILETEPFDLSFETPEVDCSTEELMLGPEINTSNKMLEYKWNNGLDDPFLIVRESGLYTIEVSDECSTESYTWEIQFPEIEQVTEVYVPNVFTPNIAGDNQFFKAFPSQQMEVIEFEFYVFDRWGNRLFLADNFDEGWDGTHLGKDINPGVYVWMYEIEYMDCKEIVRKSGHGDVTIIR